MSRSLVYSRPWVYAVVMRLLYGRGYAARLAAVAERVPPGASVVELCCGPGMLLEHGLRARGVDYTGLDLNRRFLARVERLGGRALEWDVAEDRPLPEADVVVMQASLYQFLPDPAPVVRRMLAAAKHHVVICEPIRNLADAGIPLLSPLARRAVNAGRGARPGRFTEATLDAFFAGLGVAAAESGTVEGGREKFYVLNRE